jgi:hypothetical protein
MTMSTITTRPSTMTIRPILGVLFLAALIGYVASKGGHDNHHASKKAPPAATVVQSEKTQEEHDAEFVAKMKKQRAEVYARSNSSSNDVQYGGYTGRPIGPFGRAAQEMYIRERCGPTC